MTQGAMTQGTMTQGTILVADAMKFSRSAPVRIGHIADVDFLVTDQSPEPELVRICGENNVIVELAPGGGEERKA